MNLRKTTLVTLLTLGLGACAGTPQAEDSQLGNNKIRLNAVHDAAISYGAQSGLAFRAQYLNRMLQAQHQKLDDVFNFRGMLLKHNVLPPVLADSQNSLNLADNNTIRMADKVVEVLRPARFVTAPPTWRNYLHLETYKIPEMPNETLLPKDGYEWQLWREGIRQGWDQGVEQANNIFAEGLSRMKRDLHGMVLYRIYASQRMISRPQVGLAKLGVTGDNHLMRVNDQVMRITAHADLQPNEVKRWRPIIITQ